MKVTTEDLARELEEARERHALTALAKVAAEDSLRQALESVEKYGRSEDGLRWVAVAERAVEGATENERLCRETCKWLEDQLR